MIRHVLAVVAFLAVGTTSSNGQEVKTREGVVESVQGPIYDLERQCRVMSLSCMGEEVTLRFPDGSTTKVVVWPKQAKVGTKVSVEPDGHITNRF